MTDESTADVVIRLARKAATDHYAAAHIMERHDNPPALLHALIRTYTAAVDALCTRQGQLAVRTLIGEVAERHNLPWEVHLAALVILACEQADDHDLLGTTERLYQVGHAHFEEVAGRLPGDGWAINVLAAIPVVFGMALPALHGDAGLVLLERFANEVTTE